MIFKHSLETHFYLFLQYIRDKYFSESLLYSSCSHLSDTQSENLASFEFCKEGFLLVKGGMVSDSLESSFRKDYRNTLLKRDK